MKRLVILLVLASSTFLSNAQVFHIPASRTTTTTDIAEYITSRVKAEREIARSIYSWVTANIRYDPDSANRINFHSDPNMKITAALRRRKGVCENYAAIFNDIAIKSGLRSVVVGGYTKQGGHIDRTGHAWCAMNVDNEWFLFDPTWDEGMGTFRYFLAEPSEFIQTHMPFDPIWQLLENPVSHQGFYNGYLYSKRKETFNYKDSINAYLRMTELEQLQSSSIRILEYGLYNPLVKNNLSVTRMNIEMIHEDKDMDLYNSSVAELNTATSILNNFILYRNNQFLPVKNDSEIKSLLEGIHNYLNSAKKKLEQVDRSAASLTLSTGPVRNKLNSLALRLQEQKDFLDLYLKSGITERAGLFYK